MGEMDPCVWSKLPGEILELVFAQLPVGRVRALSKRWSLAGLTYCAFTRASAALQPNLCGIMWRDHFSTPTYHVRAYDPKSCKWLDKTHKLTNPELLRYLPWSGPRYQHSIT